ncbi:MAG TPA: phosphopantothenoylcysteine decarboxylase, partial [Chitinophagaceae bacterium]|nr:phosphopantothenoylcysteine decarboxylase [Chitinophagaceae bacterium]
FAIARSFYLQGADVVLVTGPTHETIFYSGIKIINVESASEMFDACTKHADANIIVMSAAVADYTPAVAAGQKIKKNDELLQISLTKTKDILKHLGSIKKQGQYLVGFALETENEVLNATKKLKEKNADCIILNSLNDEGAGFMKDTNKISIITPKETISFELKSKEEVAENIVEYIINQSAK